MKFGLIQADRMDWIELQEYYNSTDRAIEVVS